MKYLVVVCVFLIIFFFSINLVFYHLLRTRLGILDSYLLDELLFFFVFSVLSITVIFKRKIFFKIKKVLLSLFLIIFTFFVQRQFLFNYFIGDDLFVMLVPLNHPEMLEYRYIARLDYFYYHFMPFSTLFKFFGYQAIYYNIFAIFMLGVSGISLFYFLIYLNKIFKFRFKLLPFLVTVFYLTTPNIVGHFRYIEHGAAIGLIATLTITCLYLYLKFLNEGKKSHNFFILSYLLILFLLKTSLTRVGFLPVVLILLEIFFLAKDKNGWRNTILRIILVFIPFFIIGKPYFSPGSVGGGVLYGIGLDRFINFDRLYMASASFVGYLVPFYFFAPVVNYVYAMMTVGIFPSNFVLNNLVFSAGILMFIGISFILFFLHLKKENVKLITFFWLSGIAAILFYALAGGGNIVKIAGRYPFDVEMTHYLSGFTNAGYTIIPLIFLLITLYLLIANRRFSKVVCLSLVFLNLYNIYFTNFINKDTVSGVKVYKAVVEDVLKIVPDNNEDKVVYSVKGEIHDVRFLGLGDIKWFYKNKPAVYIADRGELTKYLKENKIKTSNLYAFYFSDGFFTFENKSDEIRKEMSSFLY